MKEKSQKQLEISRDLEQKLTETFPTGIRVHLARKKSEIADRLRNENYNITDLQKFYKLYNSYMRKLGGYER